MDGDRFDRATKSLATGVPRRTILTGLAGGSLVAALGLQTPKVSARACRETQRKCNDADQCCGGKSACEQVTKLTCQLEGKRCCGQKGAKCKVRLDGCDCCDTLICNPLTTRCDFPL